VGYPRELKHRGGEVLHHVWDGAVKSAGERIHSKYLLGLEDAAALEDDEETTDRLFYTTLRTFITCIMHHAHNSFSRGVSSWLKNPVTMRSMWICQESLRGSFGLFATTIGPWLTQVVEFEEWSFAAAGELWTLAGFTGEWLLLVVNLQIRFVNGKLLISPAYRDNPRLIEWVTTVLFKAWKIKRWANSRWLTIGFSCRSTLRSVLLGTRSLAKFIFDSGKQFHVRGFVEHCSKEVLEMCVVVSLGSFALDNFLLTIMKDDRVPAQLDAMMAQLRRDISYTENISPAVWKHICDSVGCTVRRTRSLTISCAITGVVNLQVRLREADRHPWSLVRGDWRANLDALKVGPRPVEDNAIRIWEGLNNGVEMDQYMPLLGFLYRAGWAANGTEQAHMAAKGSLRLHKEQGLETTQARACIGATRPLVTQLPDKKALDRARRHLAVLDGKQPQKFGGRQEYLRELNAQAEAWRAEGRDVDPNVHDALMLKHGAMWQAMGQQRRDEYEARAVPARQLKAEGLLGEKEETVNKIETLKAKLAEQHSTDNPVLLSQCKLGPQDLAEMEAEFSNKRWTVSAVQSRLDKAGEAVVQPSPDVQRLIESVQLPPKPARPARPEWLPLLAKFGEFFQDCVFRLPTPDGPTILKYSLGLQKPYLVGFIECSEEGDLLPEPGQEDPFQGLLDGWPHVFVYNMDLVYFTDEWPFDLTYPLEVLQGVTFLGYGLLASATDTWQPLHSLAELLPEATWAEEETTGGPEPGPWHKDEWLECPWLLDFLATGEQKPQRKNKPSNTTRKHDVDALMVMEALNAARAHWEALDPHYGEQFKWQLLGGEWLAEERGITYDNFEGSARGKDTIAWCVQYTLPRETKFSIAWYTMQGAFVLVNEWIHKMQWLYDGYNDTCADVDWDIAGTLADFRHTDEFLELEAAKDKRTLVRCRQIRQILPRKRGG